MEEIKGEKKNINEKRRKIEEKKQEKLMKKRGR